MDNLKKVPIHYTYPKKKVINNGKINMLDNYYVFDASDKKTILKDGDTLFVGRSPIAKVSDGINAIATPITNIVAPWRIIQIIGNDD